MRSLYLLRARERKSEPCDIQINSSVNDPVSSEDHRRALLWFPTPRESAGVLDGDHRHLSGRGQSISLVPHAGHRRVFEMEADLKMDPL